MRPCVLECLIGIVVLVSFTSVAMTRWNDGHAVLFISPFSVWCRANRDAGGKYMLAGFHELKFCRLSKNIIVPLMVDPLGGIPGLGVDTDPGSDMEDPTTGGPITDADIKEIMDIIKDVKQGKMGPVWKKEMEAAEDLYKRRDAAIRKMPGGSEDEPKPDVNELLNEKNDYLDAKLKEVFDFSDLRHPSDEDIMKSIDKMENEDKGLLEHPSVSSPEDENYEQYFKDVSEGKLSTEDMKSMVNQYYRQKGLLNEPVVKTMVGRFEVHWKQNTKTFDMWFPCVSSEDKEDDYSIQFLPQQITISYRGASVSRELRGKVDVDGCFWSMQDLPNKGKFIGIVLLKRSPMHLNTWDHLFRGTKPKPPQS